jgi:cytochrome c1
VAQQMLAARKALDKSYALLLQLCGAECQSGRCRQLAATATADCPPAGKNLSDGRAAPPYFADLPCWQGCRFLMHKPSPC